MTLDQAIRILDPATTTEELERIYYYGGFHGNEVTDAAINEALRIALEVMRNCYKEKSNMTLTEFCEMAGGQFKAITINVFDGKVNDSDIMQQGTPSVWNSLFLTPQIQAHFCGTSMHPLKWSSFMQLTAMFSMWCSQSELVTRQTKFLRRNKIESSILRALYHCRGVYLGLLRVYVQEARQRPDKHLRRCDKGNVR